MLFLAFHPFHIKNERHPINAINWPYLFGESSREGNGSLLDFCASFSPTTFTYDKQDNLKTTTDPQNQLISRVYDNNSRLTSITTPDNTIMIGYDAGNNPTNVTDSDSQVTLVL